MADINAPLRNLAAQLNASQGLSNQTPSSAFGEGYLTMKNIQMVNAAQQAQADADFQAKVLAIQENQRAQKIAEMKAAIMAKPFQERTVEDYTNLMLMQPKESEALKSGWSMISPAQQEDVLSFGGKIMALDKAENYAASTALLQNRAHLETTPQNKLLYSKLSQMTPEQRSRALGTLLVTVPKGADVVSALTTREKGEIDLRTLDEKNQLDLLKTKAEIDKLRSEGAKAGREVQGINKEEQKQMIKDRVESRQLTNELRNTQMLLTESSDVLTNAPQWASGISEGVKSITGISNDATKFKQKYREWRQKAMATLFKGQGAISDAERAAFDKVYPNENAPEALIKSALTHHIDMLNNKIETLPTAQLPPPPEDSSVPSSSVPPPSGKPPVNFSGFQNLIFND
jgi:hypothetical protein